MRMTAKLNVTVVTAMLASTLAWAAGGDRQGPPPRGAMHGGPERQMMRDAMMIKMIENPRVVEALKLTDDQVERLQDGAYELKRERIELRSQLELAALEQARLFTREPVDEAALMEAVEATGAVRTEIAKLDARGLVLVMQTLTEEQRDKARRIMARNQRARGGGDGMQRGARGDRWQEREGARRGYGQQGKDGAKRGRGGFGRGEWERPGPPPPPEALEPAPVPDASDED